MKQVRADCVAMPFSSVGHPGMLNISLNYLSGLQYVQYVHCAVCNRELLLGVLAVCAI